VRLPPAAPAARWRPTAGTCRARARCPPLPPVRAARAGAHTVRRQSLQALLRARRSSRCVTARPETVATACASASC
jgi:hypothetical protein